MTTDDHGRIALTPQRLNDNLAQSRGPVAASGRRRWRTSRTGPQSLQGPAPGPLRQGGRGLLAEMMANPAKLLEHADRLLGQVAASTTSRRSRRWSQGELEAPEDPRRRTGASRTRCGRRIPISTSSSSSICCNADADRDRRSPTLEGLDADEQQAAASISRRQIIDMMSADELPRPPTPRRWSGRSRPTGESLVERAREPRRAISRPTTATWSSRWPTRRRSRWASNLAHHRGRGGLSATGCSN